MAHKFDFTFANIEEQFRQAKAEGYKFITCRDYTGYKKSGSTEKVIVNRVDIDLSLKKTKRLAEIFNRLGIPATFFVRLHAPEYNPVSFEGYKVLRFLLESGHELGYHSEIVDQAAIWGESAEECLVRDIRMLENYFGITIDGVASHGGMTGLNNLDFWKDRKPSEFGLLYEAYDKEPEFNLFQEAFYVSDSNWTYWKCYDKGVLRPDDRRSLSEHARDGHKVIYSLIHPDTYFDEHFYE